MSLTRITSGVVSSNAISTEKLANGSIVSRNLANGSIEVKHLSSAANSFATTASISSNLTANLIQITANINAVQSNVNSQRSNVNTVSSNIATGDANSVAFTANVEARRTANIAGAISSVLTSDLTASRALVSGSGGKIEVSAVTSTELGYLDGVTSAIQTQLDAKQATITGSASTIDTESLTADRAVISNGSQKIAVSDVTSTELGYLDGVTSAIQTQLDAKAALAGATFSGQVNMNDDLVVTGNLIVNGDTTTANTVNMVVQDRMLMLANSATGAPGSDVGILFNRGNQGNAAIFYDESARTFKLSDTKDPSSNVNLSPVTASNLDVGIITAATLNATAITQNGATLDNLIGSNVDGAISTVHDTDLTASRALASSGSGKIAVSAVTATELGYLDGVTSAIQTQLNAKQATITGAATTIDDADLTASRALVSSGSGKVAVSDVTSTELGHLDGVTSAIQTQINSLTTNINTLDSNADANFTQLNANINVVSGNAAVGLKQLTNVISSTGANTFHVATPPGSTNPTTISNVQVFIDGLAQKPKTSSSDNDYIYTSGSGLVTVTDASLPSGLTVQITALYPPS
tara:strand:- start:1257 stop:3005 length:1749 start_codon:yes stop_codon:yes gene_type:complete